LPSSRWDRLQREAAAIVGDAQRRGVTVRVVGSTGIRMHCDAASAAMDGSARDAKDIDLLVSARQRAPLRRLLEENGYVTDRDVLVAMEGMRLCFRHPRRAIDVDVFVDKLEFCHTIELERRLDQHPTTLAAADLLLQKLQLHELTNNDLLDASIVLATHPVVDGEASAEEIDGGYIARLLSRDWGFHHDAVANLGQLRTALVAGDAVPLAPQHRSRARGGADALAAMIEAAPKSRGWRLRARVGERMQWWDDVNERVETY
jgi:hypothetical protein